MNILRILRRCGLIALLGFTAPAAAWEIEAGIGLIDGVLGSSMRVQFSESFAVTPVVVVTPASSETTPANLRISDVTADGFTATISTPPLALRPPLPLAFSFLAVEPGEHRLPDGRSIVAGTVETDQILNGERLSAALIPWPGDGSLPAVLSSLQTDRNGRFMIATANEVSTTSFGVAMDVEGRHHVELPEVIGYIALDPGTQLYTSATDPLPIAVEAIAEVSGVGGPDDDVDGLPLTPFPVDCKRVPLQTLSIGAIASRTGTLDADASWARLCTSAAPGIAVPLVLDEHHGKAHTAAGDPVAVLAFERPFHARLGRVADYQFDACELDEPISLIDDFGPYELVGNGSLLGRLDVRNEPAPGPQCRAASFADAGAQVRVRESDSDRLGITGAITLAAWVRPGDAAAAPPLQTIAGKGGDSYRLSLEAVCVTVPLNLNLTPPVVVGTKEDLLQNSEGICDDPLGILNAEWKYQLRVDLTNSLGLSFTARSASTVISNLWDPTGELRADQWRHVAFSYDGTQIRLFLDAVERPSLSVGSVALPLQESAADFAIGATLDADGNPSSQFLGAIDEVTVWNGVIADPDTGALPVLGQAEGYNEALDLEHRQRVRECAACAPTMIFWRERYRR